MLDTAPASAAKGAGALWGLRGAAGCVGPATDVSERPGVIRGLRRFFDTLFAVTRLAAPEEDAGTGAAFLPATGRDETAPPAPRCLAAVLVRAEGTEGAATLDAVRREVEVETGLATLRWAAEAATGLAAPRRAGFVPAGRAAVRCLVAKPLPGVAV